VRSGRFAAIDSHLGSGVLPTQFVWKKKNLLKTVGTVELCTVDPWRRKTAPIGEAYERGVCLSRRAYQRLARSGKSFSKVVRKNVSGAMARNL
jgi:hypothetical protein